MDATDVRGLLGLLLPNGNLVHYPTPAGGFIQLTLTAGKSDSAFLDEKVQEFNRFIPTRAKVVPYKTKAKPSRASTEVLRFRVSSNRLRPVYNMLYPEGSRQISQTVLDILGARAAAWLWADGARAHPNGSAHLARVGQTQEEALLIARWLFVLTGAEAFLDEAFIRPRLVFTAEDADKIRAALFGYAPKTRVHLFQDIPVDHVLLRSHRTELRARLREDLPEEEDGAALAGDPSSRRADGLPEASAQDAPEAESFRVQVHA